MKSVHTTAALVLLSLATTGCCSSTIGRADSADNLDWTLEQVARHNREDWENTRANVSSIPAYFTKSTWDDAVRNWQKTCRLYFLGSTKPITGDEGN